MVFKGGLRCPVYEGDCEIKTVIARNSLCIGEIALEILSPRIDIGISYRVKRVDPRLVDMAKVVKSFSNPMCEPR